MPRSTRLSTAPKRNSRRKASEQSSVYDLPESPIEAKIVKNDEHHADNSPIRSTTPPTASMPLSSSTSSPTAVSVESDLRLTGNRPPPSNSIPVATLQPVVPGFEALEAVNSLYQQLKDSHSRNAHLKRQNEILALELEKQKRIFEKSQKELGAEKEKSSDIQKNQEKEVHKLRQASKDDLNTILKSLRRFGSAAHDLLPLLDVLAGAPEINYDEDTEKLHEVLKQHQPKILPK